MYKRTSRKLRTLAIIVVSMTLAFIAGVYSRPDAVQANNDTILTINHDECIEYFIAFYTDFPSYHYEADDGSIVIDYRVPNPQEEAYQYCDYFFNK